ncbi:hypothetical protein MRX96_003945 [Rhipicephalus microplus]
MKTRRCDHRQVSVVLTLFCPKRCFNPLHRKPSSSGQAHCCSPYQFRSFLLPSTRLYARSVARVWPVVRRRVGMPGAEPEARDRSASPPGAGPALRPGLLSHQQRSTPHVHDDEIAHRDDTGGCSHHQRSDALFKNFGTHSADSLDVRKDERSVMPKR